jgi:DNA-directed RNA polymerase specialized sigma24 family protein
MVAWDSSDPGRLNYQEVQDSLVQLSEADLRRAERIADFLARGLPGAHGEDLLQEVYVKLLSGDRRFPRGVHTVKVLKSAMESEASNARKAGRTSPVDLRFRVEDGADAADRRSPEVQLVAREQFDALMATCSGDPDAELVVMAWADGLKGADAHQATGLAAKAFDSARKRATRKLAGFEPRGDGR